MRPGFFWNDKFGNGRPAIFSCNVPGPMDVPHGCSPLKKTRQGNSKKPAFDTGRLGLKQQSSRVIVDSDVIRLTCADANQCALTNKRPHNVGIGKFGWARKLELSYNERTSKSSILIGFSIINQAFWGTPICGNPHICPEWCKIDLQIPDLQKQEKPTNPNADHVM